MFTISTHTHPTENGSESTRENNTDFTGLMTNARSQKRVVIFAVEPFLKKLDPLVRSLFILYALLDCAMDLLRSEPSNTYYRALVEALVIVIRKKTRKLNKAHPFFEDLK